MQRLQLNFIGDRIKKWVITPQLWRILESSIYTLLFWALTYLSESLSSGNRAEWRVTLVVLVVWFLKAILSGVMMAIRAVEKDKQLIVDTVLTNNPTE